MSQWASQNLSYEEVISLIDSQLSTGEPKREWVSGTEYCPLDSSLYQDWYGGRQ